MDDEHLKLARIYENMACTLTLKNQENFYTSKLNYVFHGWKEYTQRRKRCCQILSYSLRKCALQKTFTMINQFSRQKDLSCKQQDTAGKMYRIFSKYRCKAALSKWREHEYFNMTQLVAQTEEECNQMVEAHNVHRA